MTPCVRLHSTPNEHTPPCTCTTQCPDHEDHCPGCLPVEAEHGLLCSTCSRRLRGFLGAEEGLGEPGRESHGLPWAWEHLEHAYPSLSQAPGKGGSSVDDPEAERLAAVVSLRADVAERLLFWTLAVMNASRRAGPDIPAPERLAVRRCATWLLGQVETLESHPDVAVAWQELADLMSRAHALAPWRPVPTEVRGIPCRCGALALHDHGAEYVCWACRWVFTPEQFRVWVRVLAHRFGDQVPAGTWERKVLEPERAGYGGRA